jgi:glucose-6-phosphate 1-dehydrogenase
VEVITRLRRSPTRLRRRVRGAAALERLEPHVIVLFGATGDLARRKLLPGMAHPRPVRALADICVVGTSLEDLDDESFREFAKEAVKEFSTHRLSEEQWTTFAARLHYVPTSAGPEGLRKAVESAEQELGGGTSGGSTT